MKSRLFSETSRGVSLQLFLLPNFYESYFQTLIRSVLDYNSRTHINNDVNISIIPDEKIYEQQ